MEFIIGFFIGALLVSAIINLSAKYYLATKEKELNDALKKGLQDLKDKIIPARIDDVNGMLFLYNRETEEFLAQGKNMDELNRIAKQLYPNKLFNVPQEQLDKLRKN